MAYQEVFTALADPTRRNIFEALLADPQTVGELAAGQPVNRPAVSQHLKVLQSAQLVSVEPQSNWEAFGDMAEMMRGGYGGSWGLLFEEAYKSACGE